MLMKCWTRFFFICYILSLLFVVSFPVSFIFLCVFLYQFRSSLSPISFIWQMRLFFSICILLSNFWLLISSPYLSSLAFFFYGLFLFHCISYFSFLNLLSFLLSIILFLFSCISWSSLLLSSLSSFPMVLFLFHCISSRYKKPFRGSFKWSPPRWNSLWMAPSALNHRVNINDFHLHVFRSAAACP